MKILTIGGATEDLFLHHNSSDAMTINRNNTLDTYMLFQSGEKIEVQSIARITGGGATNSAVSFQRMGLTTQCFCSIGDDTAGKNIIHALNSEKIDTSIIHTTPEHPTGTSCIIQTQQGDHTIFAFRGANGHLELDKLPFEAIKQANQLYITSLSNKSALLLPKIVSFAQQHNVPVAINPGISQLAQGTAMLKEALQYIDILIMNSLEARTFMTALAENDHTYKTILASTSQKNACSLNLDSKEPYLIQLPILCEKHYFSIQKFFQQVLTIGPKIVVITNGANGVYVATKSNMYFHPSIKIPIVNAVGAGDAFGSCFVGSLLLDFSLEEALRNGIHNSASVLGFRGAKEGLLNISQLKNKLSAQKTNLIQTFQW